MPATPGTPFRGLDSMGGWSQIKIRANNKLEFNAGFGLDNPKTSEVLAFAAGQAYMTTLVQNRSVLGNFIYRPRSDLLFSAEFRHLQSNQIYSISDNAQQINLIMGILF
jgi:hypothetical protein